MKYIIIGLGNFGASLSVRLTAMGHEVIGVDTDMNKVEEVKDKITHAINLNATSLPAVKTLAFKDMAVVIISIGEDIGASIMTTAIFRQLNVKWLISQAIRPCTKRYSRPLG